MNIKSIKMYKNLSYQGIQINSKNCYKIQLKMLSPNCLIFPQPRYNNLDKEMMRIKEHLIYIPKLQRQRRVSHLQDLTLVSKEQLARRFSSYDFAETNTENIEFNNLTNKQQNIESLTNNSQVVTKKIKSSLSIRKQPKNKQEQDKNQATQIIKIRKRLSCLSNKLKPNEIILSQYSSVKTTARTQMTKKMMGKYNCEQSFLSNNNLMINQIPCVYLQYQSLTTQQQQLSNKLLVYYHANGEDILNCFQFINALSTYFKTNVLVIQYPGYSIYSNKSHSQPLIKHRNCIQQQDISQQIRNDIPFVMTYIKNTIGFDMNDVIVVGRSIGTGPAIQIATKYDIGALVLLSPFAKFYQVAQSLYGKVAGMIVKQPFDNFTNSQDIKCPVLIMHGLQDKTIHYSQSIQLSCNIKTYCSLRLIENMTHNKFHFQSDIFYNVEEFLYDVGFEMFKEK